MPTVEPNDVPEDLRKQDIWLHYDTSADTPRRPHKKGDFGISWSDPDEWMSFEEAVESASEVNSWGVGYVNSYDNDNHATGLLVTIDIDGGLDKNGDIKDWVPELEPFDGNYIERSPSGEGLHIPLVGYDVPEWWNDMHFSADEHEGVDVLSNKFCTCTGDSIFGATDQLATPSKEVDRWLAEVYREIKGKLPGQTSAEANEENHPDIDEEQVREALEYINPDCSYPEWRNIGFALVNHFGAGKKAERLFDEWSRRASSYDGEAKRLINKIANDADENGGVTIGTLIHKAKQGGWEPEWEQYQEPERTSTPEPEPEDSDEETDEDEPLSQNGIIKSAGYDPDETEISDLNNSEMAYALHRELRKSDEHNFRVVRDNGDIYRFNGEIWEDDGEERLHEIAFSRFRMDNSKRLHKEILHAIRGAPMRKVERDKLGAPPETVAVDNGLLDLRNRELSQLRAEHMATRQLPVEYDPEADCPRWRDLIDDAVDPADAKKLQEYAGYCLWQHEQPFGKALFLVGPTDSGKGTIIKAIKSVLGEDNVSNESLYNLLSTRWGSALLFGKIANFNNEVQPRGLDSVEKFKKMTGQGDKMTAEKKGQDKFEFRVTQKFVFATNQMPTMEDAGEPFWNRVLFVSVPNTVPEDEQDPRLLEKLREEKSGILNWMLEGLERLLENGQFTAERDIKEKRTLSDAFGSAVDRFKFSCLEVTGNQKDVVHKDELYQMFKAHAKKMGRGSDTPGKQMFTKELKQSAGIDDGQSRKVSQGDRNAKSVYKGVKVNPEAALELGFDDIPHSYESEEKRDDGQEGLR